MNQLKNLSKFNVKNAREKKTKNHTGGACFFLSLYDSMKDKPAEISLLISHSRSSEAHCRLLTGGGRCSVKDGKLTPHFDSSITFDKI